MLKKPFLCLLLAFSFYIASAQPSLQVQGTGADLYLSHKTEAKENWYSIGRTYNLSPKDIGAYNGKDINAGLSVGQVLKIPLTSANFSQNDSKAADEVLVPVYHTVKDGEWMFRVSTNHNKVPIESLEKWNKVNRSQVKAGMTLIVGYLKVKKEQSALAAANPALLAGSAPATAAASPQASPSESNNKPLYTPATPPVTPASKEISFNGGYFKNQFAGGNRYSKGLAHIFRSTSGWNDGKYYALMDNVPVGSIVQVTNTANNKSVYAKVLGELSDIRENAGLTIRISNAAAAELGGGDIKFNAEVKY
ncbi:MAG: LysM peptidoglycan-binding domain-containing protein [Flavihumibacter sp.]